MALETWKVRLKEDCKRQDKLLAYSNLGEECLQVLWEAGTDPTVQGVIEGGKKAAQPGQFLHPATLRIGRTEI